MATVRRRDVRRVLASGYRLLEIKNTSTTNLIRAWHRRFGVFPDFTTEGLLGYSWAVSDGRLLALVKPEVSNAAAPVVTLACSLLSAKHGVEVRAARPEEMLTRKPKPPTMGLTVGDGEDVDEFPPPRDHPGEQVVAAYVGASGHYLHRLRAESMFLWCPPAETLDEALVWENAEEAHDWLDLHAPAERVVLQYVATVRADIEQRLAAAYHEHTWR